MKFALVNEQRQEAQPKLAGKCPACNRPMVAKCGEVKIWHWAHQTGRFCDHWWENETEWHRAWKGQFLVNWQEIVHKAPNGEKHIADVKTNQGWVIEFQHSYIKPEERRSRDVFYHQLVWVVDGARRKRDRTQFQNVLNKSLPTASGSPVRRIFSDECALLREWADSHIPVSLTSVGRHFGGSFLRVPMGRYISQASRVFSSSKSTVLEKYRKPAVSMSS